MGIIGTEINEVNTALAPSFRDPNFCLNLADRANSNGFISSVNYCYAADVSLSLLSIFSNIQYQATVRQPAASKGLKNLVGQTWVQQKDQQEQPAACI